MSVVDEDEVWKKRFADAVSDLQPKNGHPIGHDLQGETVTAGLVAMRYEFATNDIKDVVVFSTEMANAMANLGDENLQDVTRVSALQLYDGAIANPTNERFYGKWPPPHRALVFIPLHDTFGEEMRKFT